MPLAQTLEGLPRRHPSNVNVRYLKGKASWLTEDNIEKEGDKLDQMFGNLLAEGKTPMRQTTADACATLHSVQAVSAEVKSSWDATEAGFKQQAVLLTDFFLRLNPREESPNTAIGIHLNNAHIKIQTLELVSMNNILQMLMSRYVYDSVPYTLRLSSCKAKKQTGAGMPAICYKEGATEKALPDLDWGRSSQDSNLTWWHSCRHCGSCMPCTPGTVMVFRPLRSLCMQVITTSGQIAHNWRIKRRGVRNCLTACKNVTTRKGSRFGPKIWTCKSKSVRTQVPNGAQVSNV